MVCLLDFALPQRAQLISISISHLEHFLVCADKVEPEVMAHILSKDSCGLRAWLTALPAESHAEVIVSSKPVNGLACLYLWPFLAASGCSRPFAPVKPYVSIDGKPAAQLKLPAFQLLVT